MGKPNEALAELLAEAGRIHGVSGGWRAGLARRVNELGKRQEGRDFAYDYTSVYRWVQRGEIPKPPTPALIAQALSEKLGRKITPSDFGMPDEESLVTRGLIYSPDVAVTLETVQDLGRAEKVKRRNIIAAPFVLAALAGPSRDWLLAALDETLTDEGPRQIGMRQVGGIREMFRLFQEMDVMRGGGHARVALVEYMNSFVMPMVRRKHDTDVQEALYEAAAEQAYLVGWMAYDDGLHGLAQRYLIQSLRLAQASKNNTLGAHVLAGMSDQANLLGHPHEALMIARAGQRGITIDDSPACLADLQILEARALGALGQRDAAAQAVSKAESTFQRVKSENEPEWARFIDPAYLFGEAAHTFRDIGDPAQIDRFAGESAAEAARQNRARRGALSQAALTVSDLVRNEVEQAATRGVKVIELAEAVDSSRCLETVRDLRKRFEPYGDVPEVQHFQARARELLQATSA